MTRRELITRAGAAAAVTTAASQSRILGANDRIAVALIGCGARGSYLQTVFQKLNASPVVALCDVWRSRSERAQGIAPDAKIFDDHRKLLDTPGLDAVIVATSDHWHAPIGLDVLNAGKDLYIEKPLTLKMEEGPRLVAAARVNDRVCQVGAQQRSGSHYLEARERFLRSGRLGKVSLVRTWWFDGGGGGLPREGGGSGGDLPKSNNPVLTGGHGTPPGMEVKPKDLDWNRYVAPVRYRPWDPAQYFNFRNYIDLNGGILTDKFVHWVDVVHMFMGQDGPISADTAGGIFNSNDGRTVPDTLNVHLEYPGNWITTYANTPHAGLERECIEFCGSQGHLKINRKQYEFYSAERGAKPEIVACKTDIVEEHVQNFLDCVRSRKMPNGDVLAGHRSAQAAHLANLSYLERRRIHFNPDREIVLSA